MSGAAFWLLIGIAVGFALCLAVACGVELGRDRD